MNINVFTLESKAWESVYHMLESLMLVNIGLIQPDESKTHADWQQQSV